MADGALVLIAEDEPTIALVLSEVIQDLGYTPLVARNGLQALALARERRPALVITDLMMPELDGAGLIAALRAEPGARIPTILVTAVGTERSHKAGADAVLTKPFDIAALEALLAQFLAI